MRTTITFPFSTMKARTSNFVENKKLMTYEELVKAVNKEGGTGE